MGVQRLPVDPLDRDLATLARGARYIGPLEQDPAQPREGSVWIRKDVSPPELRAQIGGATWAIPFTAV
jgi:hypothetical protein